jgi:hypothetical protein
VLSSYIHYHDDPGINYGIRLAVLNQLRKCSESKFSMFQSGPALMEVNRLDEEAKRIHAHILEEREKQRHYHPVNDFNRDINNGKLPYKNLDNLDRRNYKNLDK